MLQVAASGLHGRGSGAPRSSVHDQRWHAEQRTITYEDFAAFTLAQVDSDEYLGQAVGIYSDQVMDPAAEVRKYLEKMRKAAEQQGG
jgi:lipid II:glycine glycyltransferase (peptidoglycan interpeptide bridge formation enzyme)